MKKLTLLFWALAASFALQAQWVDDPTNNTLIANCPHTASEVYTVVNPVSSDIYVQWNSHNPNGWSPTLQRLNFAGVPQWGADGIHPSHHNFLSFSMGMAMATTTDNAVVSCFSTETSQCVAIKINADGTYAWGEEGIALFNGHDSKRTELLAGNDGGVWALTSDFENLYVCYVNADGSTNPTITISDNDGKSCMFGLLTPAPNDNVFVVYAKEMPSYGTYVERDIRVVGYSKDGTAISEDIQLMAPQSIPGGYTHYVVADGLGGAYVYIWHSAFDSLFNVYVFHFDQNGVSTIDDLNGIAVHTQIPDYHYIDAKATVDPVSHDLIIAFRQTDEDYQREFKMFVNRITLSGEKVWDDGVMFLDNGFTACYSHCVDPFENGEGFSIILDKGTSDNAHLRTIEAIGFDMDCNVIWTTEISSTAYFRKICDKSTGFHAGQNVVTWVNSTDSGLYGQNIFQDGTMGTVTTCLAPENFNGSYFFNEDNGNFGAMLTWDAPETQPLQFNLYRTDPINKDRTIIEVSPDATSYLDVTEQGSYYYQLTAVYENCESDFALTPDGEEGIVIIVSDIQENKTEEIVTLVRVYNMNGQALKCNDLSTLTNGVYIIQGLTKDGKLVSLKVVVNH